MHYCLPIILLIIISCGNPTIERTLNKSEPDTAALFQEYLLQFREVRNHEYPVLLDPLNITVIQSENPSRFRIFEPFEGYTKLPMPEKRYFPMMRFNTGNKDQYAFVSAAYEMMNDSFLSKNVTIEISIFDRSGKMTGNWGLATCFNEKSSFVSDSLRHYSTASIYKGGIITVNTFRIQLQKPGELYDPLHNTIRKKELSDKFRFRIENDGKLKITQRSALSWH